MKMINDIELIAELPYNWEAFTNSSIIISGGTGFIGAFLCDVFRYRNRIHNQNIKVYSISRRSHKDDDTVTHIQGDISLNDYNLPQGAKYVLHLASNTHPEQYKADPIGTIINNIYGCENLLEYTKDSHVDKFLLASSCEVYGECTEMPVDESYSGYIDFNTARAGYNEAKRVCESLCQSYKIQYGIDIVIARLARVFGADNTKKDTKAMAQFIDKAIHNQDIVLKSDGKQKYSYIYVADAVSGIICTLLNGENGEAYNIANDYDGMSLSDIANYIANSCGKEVVFDIQSDSSASKVKNALLSNDKIKSIGFRPLFSTKKGIDKTIDMLIGNTII